MWFIRMRLDWLCLMNSTTASTMIYPKYPNTGYPVGYPVTNHQERKTRLSQCRLRPLEFLHISLFSLQMQIVVRRCFFWPEQLLPIKSLKREKTCSGVLPIFETKETSLPFSNHTQIYIYIYNIYIDSCPWTSISFLWFNSIRPANHFCVFLSNLPIPKTLCFLQFDSHVLSQQSTKTST